MSVDLIVDIYREVLKLNDIGADHELPELAVESMQVIEIATAVYERLGAEVPLEVFIEARTPRAVAEAIASAAGSVSR
jgi:acyl carrier protein